MRIVVLVFALARQRAGGPRLAIDLPDGATVADLRRALADSRPALAPLLPNLMVAVDSDYAEDGRVIPPGAEVALIPPVSGGGQGDS